MSESTSQQLSFAELRPIDQAARNGIACEAHRVASVNGCSLVEYQDVLARGIWKWARRPTLLVCRLWELTLAHAREIQTVDDRVVTIPYASVANVFPSWASDDHIAQSVADHLSILTSLQVFSDDRDPVLADDGQTPCKLSVTNVIERVEARGGVIKVLLTGSVMPLFARLGDHYDWPKTWHRLRSVADLTTPWQFTLYTWLLSHAPGEVEITLADLRRKLRLDPESTRERPVFVQPGQLMRRVLAPTIARLNETTDLKVDMEVIQGPRRKTLGYRFKVHREQLRLSTPAELAVAELLIRSGVNRRLAEDAVEERGIEHCLLRLSITRERVVNGSVQGSGGYLAKLLRMESIKIVRGRDYAPYREEVLSDMSELVFAGMPNPEKDRLRGRFSERVVRPERLGRYWEAEKENHPAIRRHWRRFLRDQVLPLKAAG